jgi:hypothetical protein
MRSIAGYLTPLNVVIGLAVLLVIVGRLSWYMGIADRAHMVPRRWSSWFHHHKTSEKTSH